MSNGKEDKNCKYQLFKRNNYFYGKLMTVRDFEDEQKYINDKRYLLNQTLHGNGIVCGFDPDQIAVSVKSSADIYLTFNKSGFALDICGHEIYVPSGTQKKIVLEKISATTFWYLYLRYKPVYGELVHSASNPSSCDETCCPNRIIEDFEIIASSDSPTISAFSCPNLSGASNSNAIREEIKLWLIEKTKACPDSEELKVFFLALKTDWSIDKDETIKYLYSINNHKTLTELSICHISDLSNPHKTTALQTGSIVSIDGVSNPGGNIDLIPANSITITPNNMGNTITIGENHSIKQVDPSSSDTTRDKHISNADAKKWNSAISNINHITPDSNGNFSINAGSNVSITAGTNSITIASTSGGSGAECITGFCTFKDIGAGTTRKSNPFKLKNRIYGVILGVEYKNPLGHKSFILTGDELWNKGIELSSSFDLGQNELVIILTNRSREPIAEVRVRWWAIAATAEYEQEELIIGPDRRIIEDDIVKDIAANPNITFRVLTTRYNISNAEIDEIINPLIERGVISSTGTGLNRKFIVNV